VATEGSARFRDGAGGPAAGESTSALSSHARDKRIEHRHEHGLSAFAGLRPVSMPLPRCRCPDAACPDAACPDARGQPDSGAAVCRGRTGRRRTSHPAQPGFK
jgi:hypothetical protein